MALSAEARIRLGFYLVTSVSDGELDNAYSAVGSIRPFAHYADAKKGPRADERLEMFARHRVIDPTKHSH